MSTVHDEDSSQFEKLLPSSTSTNTTTTPTTRDHAQTTQQNDVHVVDMKTSPIISEVKKPLLNGEISHIHDKETDDTLSTFNPDKCYSWLKPPFDNVTVGKKSKDDGESSETSSDSASLPMPQAPDGGWGWFVVLGAFSITVICDGVSYGFGVIYSELIVQFGESRSKTSLIGAIFFGVAMMLGPVASVLTTRFGCRTMTIVGGILSAIGFMLSSFATSVEMLCFTFSVVVGVGFSFCYITSVVVVAFYFDKRRALATGLAVCGTGVGTFTFAPLMDMLLAEYGVRGLFFIMSAISLNLVVCGLLFRPLHFTESERWEMLLQEFNKIPYSREDIELSRSRYPSDTSDYDSDEEALDEEQRTLSVLSLPTFVNPDLVDNIMPSEVLMEALKTSKNPHHTLQRYMKNAMLHIDHLRPDHDPVLGSPVDDRTYTITVDPPKTDDTVDSLPSSLLDDNILKISPDEPIPQSILPASSVPSVKIVAALTNDNVPVTVLKLNEKPNRVSSVPTKLQSKGSGMKDMNTKILPSEPRDPSTKVPPAPANPDKQGNEKKDTITAVPNLDKQSIVKKDTNMKLEVKNYTKPADTHNLLHKRQEFSGMSNMLTDRGCEMERKSVGRRLVGVRIGRHSALGIHLPLYRTDIFYRRLLKHNATMKHCTLGTSCPELLESAAPESERGIVYQKVTAFLDEVCEIMKGMIEFRLFLNPFFIVFVISNFIFYFWSDIPYMYSADHAVDNGYDKQRASFLVAFLGIFNTVGQVVFGFVGDLNINLLNIYAIISAISGVFVALIPVLVDTYVGLCMMYSLFGFFVSVSYPLTTVLLVNYLGVAKLTNAYGLLMLMQGIANLLGPPFAGWVSDKTGNYDAAFYLSGIFYFIAGICLFFVYIPKCRKWARKARGLSDEVSITVEAP